MPKTSGRRRRRPRSTRARAVGVSLGRYPAEVGFPEGVIGPITRVRHIEMILEGTSPWTVQSRLLEVSDYRQVSEIAGNATCYRVRRVGIEVMPGSIMEWVVLPGVPGRQLDTREELLKCPGTVQYRNLQGTARIFWYTPLGVNALWTRLHDTASHKGIWTGLHMWYLGNNLLESGGSGIMGRFIWELELGGVLPQLPS